MAPPDDTFRHAQFEESAAPSLTDTEPDEIARLFATAVRRKEGDRDCGNSDGRRELMYEAGEAIFPLYGPRMVACGWSLFPQERSGNRGPAVVDGRALKWGVYQTRLPTPAEVASWAAQCPTHNVAIITGKASSGIFAIDIDIGDHDKSWAVEQLAVQQLGLSPFRRIGRPPRILLVYRCEDELRKRAIRYGDDAAVEILANGAPFTAYGKHHSLGKYFNWQAYELVSRGPMEAPLVTVAQLDAFLDAVEKLMLPEGRPQAPARTGPVGIARMAGSFVVPPNGGTATGSSYDPATKRLRDEARDPYVLERTRQWARHNGGRSFDDLFEPCLADILANIGLSGKWTEAYAEQKVRSNLRGACEKRDAGAKGFSVVRVYHGEDGQVLAPEYAVVEQADDDADIKIITKPTAKRRRLQFVRTDKCIIKAGQRALIKSRKARALRTDQVSLDVTLTIQRFLDDLWDAVRNDDEGAWARLNTIWLMIAPTGAGKTSTFMKLFAEQVKRRGPLGGPVALMMPSYDNINETDRKRREEQAKAAEKAAEELAAHAEGIRILIYKGKIRAGCQMADAITALQKSAVGTSSLCKRPKPVEEQEDEADKYDYCSYYHVCPAIAQRREIEHADLILLPTAFLDTNIPEELKKHLKALIVDERCWTNLVHQTTVPLVECLKAGRRQPYWTEKEKRDAAAAGKTLGDTQGFLQERLEVADVIITALRKGVDPALAVLDYRSHWADGSVRTGEELLESAIFVNNRTSLAAQRVKPNLSSFDLKQIIDDEQDKWLWADKRALKLIKERVQWLKEDRANANLATDTGCPVPPTKAKGRTDRRLALLRPSEGVENLRLAWRTDANFGGLPTLMLDASAEPAIVEKLWNGRQVDPIRIEAPLHLRVLAIVDSTYSNASMLPGKNEGMRALQAAVRQDAVKSVVNGLSVLFNHSRLLVGTTKTIEHEFARVWTHLSNVDWLHFGNCRGFDFAKFHGCCLSIGRLEMPPSFIDGMVAALTYDDDDPEAPIDPIGNGKHADGSEIRAPMVDRVHQMRDGSDITLRVPEWPGYWARLVQRQFREEETRQFIGRLRPVYQEDEAPLAVIMSSVMPPDLVIDDMVRLEDVIHQNTVWNAVARTGGLLDPKLCARIAPDLDPLVEVNRALRQIEEEGGLAQSRLGRGFVRYEYCRQGDIPKQILLGASVEDPIAAIAAIEGDIVWGKIDRKYGIRVIERGYDGPRLAQAREPDKKFVDAVGTMEQRARDAENLREELRIEGLMKGNTKVAGHTRLIQAGDGELSSEYVSLSVKGLLRLAGKG